MCCVFVFFEGYFVMKVFIVGNVLIYLCIFYFILFGCFDFFIMGGINIYTLVEKCVNFLDFILVEIRV